MTPAQAMTAVGGVKGAQETEWQSVHSEESYRHMMAEEGIEVEDELATG